MPEHAGDRPLVVGLDDPLARDPALTGAKAANLALAAAAGLPTIPGEVLTTAAPVTLGTEPDPTAIRFGDGLDTVLREMWDRVGDGGRHPLVVRSSSTVEDLGASSMAGRFTSVVGVTDADAFDRAVRTVLASAVRAALADGVDPRPMAVLVQRAVRPACGGVLFGVDPVTGDRRRIVVETSPLGPEAVVGGAASAALATLSRRGRLLDADPDAVGFLPRRRRRALARLARLAGRRFAVAQDIEWAVDAAGTLWLLQTRPVTSTSSAAAPSGPLLGPGPLGETFPLPLRPLEQDLWLDPVHDAMAEVLGVLGAAGRRALGRSPVVTVVDGWAVCDLHLVGMATTRQGWRSLAPLPALRHLRAAWRVGTLRGGLPALADDLEARVAAELAAVPALGDVDDAGLVGLLRRQRDVLRSLHGHQMLAALLLSSETGTSLAQAAVAAVRRGRAGGVPDDEIVARTPVALGLVPPRIGGLGLPATLEAELGAAAPATDHLTTRDSLRLWCRLVQELMARAALELDRRLSRAGRVPAGAVAHLRLPELEAIVLDGAPAPADLATRVDTPEAAPVPAAFRLSPDGEVVAERATSRGSLGGRGAGGGRGGGVVIHDVDGLGSDPSGVDGAVLVVGSLDPRLAPVIGRLGGLVAETGSVLSHLAILAREQHVPTVVGVPDARRRFPPGTYLAVDGGTGEVRAPARSGGAR